ncbi:hypothetical protein PVK06_019413 [Gossypium arboreum]|uniref:DUF4283 domain-containing protein n=1 Tax=Gossypium arboreum TaxID=29729 RepID=A0ABR0PJL6_GOSAR|nr:hypothetical protein PVK06_019413 [Gossypium arboreum]
MEEELANLNIVDDEKLVQAFDDEDYAKEDFNFCLLRKVLTDNIVHFPSMRNLLAKLWHPIKRISITKIKDKRILYRFYNKMLEDSEIHEGDVWTKLVDGIPSITFFDRVKDFIERKMAKMIIIKLLEKRSLSIPY